MRPTTPTDGARPHVVVVGAGFGGLAAVRSLRKAPVDVTLVDRRNFHLFQPLLYQVATAALSPGDIAWPIRSIMSRQRNVTVRMMEVNAVDVDAGTVTDGTTTLAYDYLVLATGATHAYFGHDDWEPFAPGLKLIDDARQLRDRLIGAFEKADAATTLTARHRDLTVIVIGGGATGVEMAGAIAELAHHTLRGDYHAIDTATTRIILVEGGPRLLPAFPGHLSDVAKRSLEKMGVEVRLGNAVTACDADGVMVGDERIEAATMVWCAGVQASSAATWLGVEHDKAGRAQVASDFSVRGRPEVFVIGDTAAFPTPNGRPLPGLASSAKQTGHYVGARIANLASGRVTGDPFVYHHQGDLAVIGRNSAVVHIGRFQLTGFAGWLFWSLIHVLFLVGFRSRIVVAIDWLWSFFTYQRGARLISDAPPIAEGTHATARRES